MHTALHTVVGELEVLLQVRDVHYLTLCETRIVSSSRKSLGIGVGSDAFIGVRSLAYQHWPRESVETHLQLSLRYCRTKKQQYLHRQPCHRK
jgi:hypothetical protein